MAERFAEVFRLPKDLYVEGSPVLLEAGVLLKDTKTQKMLAQLKFRNLSEKTIKGLLIKLCLMDIGGAVLNPEFDYTYLDLNAKNGEEFGPRTPVYLPEDNVRNIRINGVVVYFWDGTSCITEGAGWAALPAQERIEEHFEQQDLRDQWHIELGPYSGLFPTKSDGLFRCTCGAVNLDSAERCYFCKRSLAKMQSLLEGTTLADLSAERFRLEAEKEAARLEQQRLEEERIKLEQEERERKAAEEAEKRRQRRKKARRIILLIAGILLLGFLVYATIWHVIPYVKYQNANKSLDNKAFDEAYEIFTGLGTFSDSEARATDTLYQKGLYLIESEEFITAAETFERIPEYEDSFAKAYYCRNEAAYRAADELLSAGKYLDAADAFLALGNYADSKEKVLKAKYLYAAELLENGEYEKARDAFTEISDYEDSETQLQEAIYLRAKELQEAGNYEEALNFFLKISGYKDVAALSKEARYQYALQLMDEKQYEEAYNIFRLLTNYKDCSKKKDEAKYLYAIERFDAGDYKAATEGFSDAANFEDSKERLTESRYQYGLQLENEGKWMEAANQFGYIKDFKDSAAHHDENYYKYGVHLLEGGLNYKAAVHVFSSLKDYLDSRTKLNEAKYGYVLSHKNRSDDTTSIYLSDLKRAGYKDSAAIYKELYAWKVTLVAVNTSSTDDKTIRTSVSRNCSYLHFVFEISGGPPNEKISLSKRIYWPDGSVTGSEWYWEDYYSGWTCGIQWSDGLYNGPNGATGTLTIRVYNKATGEYLGEGSVKITN